MGKQCRCGSTARSSTAGSGTAGTPAAVSGRALTRSPLPSLRPTRPHPPSCRQVEFPDGRATLCLLPAMFHKKLWVKKGNYLVVEDAPEVGWFPPCMVHGYS